MLRALLLLAVFQAASLAATVDMDVCIYSGTSGSVAAGVQAARMGKRAVIVEPGVWDRDLPLDPYVVAGDPKSGLLPLVQSGEPGMPGEPAPGVQAASGRWPGSRLATTIATRYLLQTMTSHLPVLLAAAYPVCAETPEFSLDDTLHRGRAHPPLYFTLTP